MMAWEQLEENATLVLKSLCSARWRSRMTFDQRVQVVKDVLREGRSLGFVLRFQTSPLRPRKAETIMAGRKVRLPRGGAYVKLAVRNNGTWFHDYRILVVFP